MKAYVLEKGPIARRAVLLALVGGIPATFLRFEADPFNVPKLGLLTAGVAIVAAIRIVEILQGARPDGLKWLWVPATAIVAPLVIAWIASPYKGWALFGQYGRFQGLIPYVVIVLFGVLIADAFAGRTLPLAWAFVIGGAIMGAYALLQRFNMDPFEWVVQDTPSGAGVPLSTIGNPNFTGGFLGLVLPVAIALLVVDTKRRIHAAVALVLVLGGWYVADSQGGWGAGIAGALLLLGLYFAPRWRYARYLGWAAVVIAIVMAVGSVVWALSDPGNGVTSNTVLWRGRWWVAAARMAGDSPIFGRGPNSFAVEGVQYRTVEDAIDLDYNFPDDPHSVFFSFLANGGAVAALGFLTMLVWAVRRGLRLDGTDLLAGAWFAAVAAYFVQAIVSIDELSLRLGLWVALGALVAATVTKEEIPATPQPSKRSKKRLKREPLKAWPAVAAVGVVALFSMWWSFRFMRADARVQHAKALFGLGNPDGASREYDAALDMRNEIEYRQAYGYELGQVALAAPEQGRPYLDKSNEVFEFLDDFPSIPGLVTQARILNAWSATDQSTMNDSIELYARARELDPLNAVIAVEMSDALNTAGRYNEAMEVLEATRATGESWGDWWGAIALTRAVMGDVAGAEAAVEKAFALTPGEGRATKAQDVILQGA